MSKKLTITVSEDVYARLHERVGRGRISRFLEELARPHLREPNMEAAYREMAADEAREAEAADWVGSLAGDVEDEPR